MRIAMSRTRVEKLPKYFVRGPAITGNLWIRIGVPAALRRNLRTPHTDKSELIQSLGTKDLRIAEQIEREGRVIATFLDIINEARPIETRWVRQPHLQRMELKNL